MIKILVRKYMYLEENLKSVGNDLLCTEIACNLLSKKTAVMDGYEVSEDGEGMERDS